MSEFETQGAFEKVPKNKTRQKGTFKSGFFVQNVDEFMAHISNLQDRKIEMVSSEIGDVADIITIKIYALHQ